MKLLLFLCLALSSSAHEVMILVTYSVDIPVVQKHLDKGYKVSAVFPANSTGSWAWLVVLSGPDEPGEQEKSRMAAVKAEYDRKRAEYLKSLTPVEKEVTT